MSRARIASRVTRQAACAALRSGTALWLVLYLVYTPIHLYLEPHSDTGEFSTTTFHALPLVADEHADGGHHERHPAVEHKFKVTQPTKASLVEFLPIQTVELVLPEQDCPPPRVIGFCGLSPPELRHRWHFILRAAFPVRAPSVLS